jgi:hypothetical protein
MGSKTTPLSLDAWLETTPRVSRVSDRGIVPTKQSIMDQLGSRFGGPIVLVTFLARSARPRIASLVDLQ